MLQLYKGDLIAQTLYAGIGHELEFVQAPQGQVVAFSPRTRELDIGQLTRVKEWTFFIGRTPFEDTYKIPVNIPHAQAVGLLEQVALTEIYKGTIYEKDVEYVPAIFQTVYRVTKNERLEITEPARRQRLFLFNSRVRTS